MKIRTPIHVLPMQKKDCRHSFLQNSLITRLYHFAYIPIKIWTSKNTLTFAIPTVQPSFIFNHQGDKSELKGATLKLLAPVPKNQALQRIDYLQLSPTIQNVLILFKFFSVNLTKLKVFAHLGYLYHDLVLYPDYSGSSANSLIGISKVCRWYHPPT